MHSAFSVSFVPRLSAPFSNTFHFPRLYSTAHMLWKSLLPFTSLAKLSSRWSLALTASPHGWTMLYTPSEAPSPAPTSCTLPFCVLILERTPMTIPYDIQYSSSAEAVPTLQLVLTPNATAKLKDFI